MAQRFPADLLQELVLARDLQPRLASVICYYTVHDHSHLHLNCAAQEGPWKSRLSQRSRSVEGSRRRLYRGWQDVNEPFAEKSLELRTRYSSASSISLCRDSKLMSLSIFFAMAAEDAAGG